jgi:hypothetical protein
MTPRSGSYMVSNRVQLLHISISYICDVVTFTQIMYHLEKSRRLFPVIKHSIFATKVARSQFIYSSVYKAS